MIPVALSAALGIAWSATPQAPHAATNKAKTAPKSYSKAPVAKAGTAKASPTHTAASASKTGRTKSGKTTVVSNRRYAQQQPTQERYQEIQQALVDRGYFDGVADGKWSPSSVEALKRFQREQNLIDDGKIGSLSLIALGLGPKRAPAPSEASAIRSTQQ
jgi:peptidoglycan hydrolase-like protein with peptidoglycan-binding domain